MATKKTSYYQLLISLSGIPEPLAEQEFSRYFKDLDINPHDLNLDGLRKILALYLQDMDHSMLKEESENVVDDNKKDLA
jgi:hypothetical protein